MNIGKARAIFDNIASDDYSMEEKKEAITMVVNMETHNSVQKYKLVNAMIFMLDNLDSLAQCSAYLTREEALAGFKEYAESLYAAGFKTPDLIGVIKAVLEEGKGDEKVKRKE